MYFNQIRAILIKIFMLLHEVHVQVTKLTLKHERRAKNSVFRINRW